MTDSLIAWTQINIKHCIKPYSGLNPDKNAEKNFEKIDFKETCTEIYIHRPHALDAIAMVQMIALNQGWLNYCTSRYFWSC